MIYESRRGRRRTQWLIFVPARVSATFGKGLYVGGAFVALELWLLTVGDRAFPVAASRVWNDLPQHATAAESLPVFCSRIKTQLFRRCFL